MDGVKPSFTPGRSRVLLALDRMIESVEEDILKEDPNNLSSRTFLHGERKGLMAARMYAEQDAERVAASSETRTSFTCKVRCYSAKEDRCADCPADLPQAAPSSAIEEREPVAWRWRIADPAYTGDWLYSTSVPKLPPNTAWTVEGLYAV